MAFVGGIDWGDLDAELKHFRGAIELGANATGVIHSTLHFTGDELIVEETMPAVYVQSIIDQVTRLSAEQKKRPGGYLKGSIPLPLWRTWRKEWESGPKAHGVRWRAFFTSKFEDRDFSKFRVQK